ncbi:ATP dependent DNA ligase domain-containing protein [Rhizopus microsporus]
MENSPPFEEICKVLDALSKTKGTTQKKEIFSKYLNKWRSNYGPDFYDAMRLFLPKLDTREYSLKEDALAVRLVKALGLNPSSDHGQHLKNWRLPSKISAACGDLPSIAHEKIKDRSNVSFSTKTVKETHEILDELANSNSMNNHIQILKRMIKTYTPSQIRWLLRIIVKDLKIGMTENSILGAFHKDAKAAYDSGQSLHYICNELTTSTAKFNDEHISIFYPLKPQRGVKNSDKELKKFLNDNQQLFIKRNIKETPYCYVEEKIDGDRMQMHYDPEADKFMWFTRNQNDFTERFGHSSKDYGRLSSKIFKGLPSKRVILDGEMVAHDPKTGIILPFGTVRTSTQNDPWDSDDSQPCFIVFDILWFDDKLMMQYPLEERIYLLNSLITPQGNYLKLIPRKKLHTEEELMNELNAAIDMRMEGLMVKMPFARYDMKKTNAWLKLKPDYMDALVENCNLLVVGAKYGTGRRSNKLAQFFCAVRDDTIPETEEPRFVSFSMVGIGFTNEDFTHLNSLISSQTRYNPKNQPKWLVHPNNSSEKPDIVIDYKQNLIIETKANSILESSQWGMQCALRFPRFVRVREDKNWQDITTVTDVQKAKHKGLTGTKRKTKESQSSQKQLTKKKKISRSLALVDTQRGLDSSKISKKTAIFETLKIFIASGNEEYSKQELEKLVIENGAECVQNADVSDIVIAGNTNFHVLSLINSGKYNILSFQYFLDCVKEKDLLDIEPRYTIHITDVARQEVMEYIDDWGDSYTKLVSEERLAEVLKKMTLDNRNKEYYRKLVSEHAERYFDNHIPGMLFFKVIAYFDQDTKMMLTRLGTPLTAGWIKKKKSWDKLELLSIRFKSEGGLIRETPTEDITHVVFNKQDFCRLEELTKTFRRERLPRFVTSEWIEACLENDTLVDEAAFEPKIPAALLQKEMSV